jgi:phosphoribosylamine--glycine ligase
VSVGVVLAAPGYPADPSIGHAIEGLEAPLPEGVLVFHAGTRRSGDRIVTAGGRVLTVCARGASVPLARAAALEASERISFEGRQLRRDIGAGAPADT